MIRAVSSMIGEVMMMRRREQMISITLLMILCSIVKEYSLVRSIGLSKTWSSSAPVMITSVIFGIM